MFFTSGPAFTTLPPTPGIRPRLDEWMPGTLERRQGASIASNDVFRPPGIGEVPDGGRVGGLVRGPLIRGGPVAQAAATAQGASLRARAAAVGWPSMGLVG